MSESRQITLRLDINLDHLHVVLLAGHIRLSTVNIVTGTLSRWFKRTRGSGLCFEPSGAAGKEKHLGRRRKKKKERKNKGLL